MDTTSTTIKNKIASALLKEFCVTVNQCETLFNQSFDELEKYAGNDDDDDEGDTVDDSKAEK